jgi:sugar lactone lactonase YvrE
MRLEVVTHGTDQLGECPVWLAAGQTLLRVDITAQTIISRHVATGAERRHRTDGPVGFALPTGREGVVAGIGREVHVGSTRLAAVEPDRSGNRFNDAACDARGRLWAGTMSTARTHETAALYRITADGELTTAIFGAGRIRRYRPDGRLDVEIRLPVTNPTSLAFGGPDLADLYVTSAKHRLSPEQLARQPLAGSLLRLRPGVGGRLPHRFGDG